MELGLSLGESPTTPFSFLDMPRNAEINNDAAVNKKRKKDHQKLGFCMALGRSLSPPPSDQNQDDDDDDHQRSSRKRANNISSSDLGHNNDRENVIPLQLDLLPSVPVPRGHVTSSTPFRFPWLAHNYGPGKGFDVNRQPGGTMAAVTGEEVTEEGVTISSPNSTLTSFHMDFYARNNTIGHANTGLLRTNHSNIIISSNNNNNNNNNNMIELETERTSSRASDDEENGSTRKKLRLSKEQSAFLEESFKEHSTLNPKQKLALAKQLNLRPRQVEVWFQNRRARTKLKQTEVDCEYLKRCCETLTEENRRLQKELQELRALKTSQPFYMQLPATTLTMCPSCERVATAGSSVSAAGSGNSPAAKPIVHPFSQPQAGKA